MRLIKLVWVLCLISLVPAASAFTNTVFSDIDGDDDLDFFLEFMVENTGSKLVNISASDGIGIIAGVSRGYFVDVDGDSDEDLFISRSGQNFLYRNNRDKTFTNITNSSVGSLLCGPGPVSAVFADFDGDSVPDAFVNQRLFLSNGSGFASLNNTNVTNASGLSSMPLMRQLAAPDLNLDGNNDLVGVDASGLVSVFLNLGDNNGDDVPEFYDASLDMGLGLYSGNNFVSYGDIDVGLAVNGSLSFFPFTGLAPPFVEDEFDDLYLSRNVSNVLLVQLFPELMVPFSVSNASSFYIPEFRDFSKDSGVDDAGNGTASVLGDFDGDGFVDVLIGNSDNTSRVMLRSGNSWNLSFSLGFNLSINSTKLIQAADWSGDGVLDLVYIDGSGAIRGSAAPGTSAFVGASPGTESSEPYSFFSAGDSQFYGSNVELDSFADVTCVSPECSGLTEQVPGKGALTFTAGSFSGTDVPIEEPEPPVPPGRGGGGGGAARAQSYGLVVQSCPMRLGPLPKLLERYWPGVPGLYSKDPRTVFFEDNFVEVDREGGEFYEFALAPGIFEYTTPRQTACHSFGENKFRCQVLYFTQVDCEAEPEFVEEKPPVIEEEVEEPEGAAFSFTECVLPDPECSFHEGVVTPLGIYSDDFFGPFDVVERGVGFVTSADLVQAKGRRFVNVARISSLGLEPGSEVKFCKQSTDALSRILFAFALPPVDFFVDRFISSSEMRASIKRGDEVSVSFLGGKYYLDNRLFDGAVQKLENARVLAQLEFSEGLPSGKFIGDYFHPEEGDVIFVEEPGSCSAGHQVKSSPVSYGSCEVACGFEGCVSGVSIGDVLVGDDGRVYDTSSDAVITGPSRDGLNPLRWPDIFVDWLSGVPGFEGVDASMVLDRSSGEFLAEAVVDDGIVYSDVASDAYCVQRIEQGTVVAQCQADGFGVILECDGELSGDVSVFAGECPKKKCEVDGQVKEGGVGAVLAVPLPRRRDLCGNAVVEAWEECDDNDPGADKMCEQKLGPGATCKNCVCHQIVPPFCGNGIVEAGEECDSGDAPCVALYGVGAVCTPACVCLPPANRTGGGGGAGIPVNRTGGGVPINRPSVPDESLVDMPAVSSCDEYGCSVFAADPFDPASLGPAQQSFVDSISLPEELVFITAPFTVGRCEDRVDATISVPDGFTDLTVFSRTGIVDSVSSDFNITCKDREWAGAVYAGIDLRSVPVLEDPLVSGSAGLSSDMISVSLSEDSDILVSNADVAMPDNVDVVPLSPFFRIQAEGVASVLIEYAELSSIDPASLVLMAYDGQWVPLDSTISEHGVSADVDLAKYSVVGLFGQSCDACFKTELTRLYDSPSDDALVLVHGVLRSHKTFMPLIEELRFTGYERDIWVFDYPNSISFEQASLELAEGLESLSPSLDSVVFVSHSLGGLITERALVVGDDRGFSFVGKTARVILAGTPHLGSRGLRNSEALERFLVNSREGLRLLGASPDLFQTALNGSFVREVDGVDYVVMAGTHPYEFSIGEFVVSAERAAEIVPNDGVVTVDSARTVAGVPYDDLCDDFFKSDWSHSGLLDEPVARKLIARLSREEEPSVESKDSVPGFDRFVHLDSADVAGKALIIAGRPVDPDARLSPALCLCGNGVCGEGENEVNCPVDCAETRYPMSLCGVLNSLALLFWAVAALSVFNTRKKRLFYASSLLGIVSLAVLAIGCSFPWGVFIFAVVVLLVRVLLYLKH